MTCLEYYVKILSDRVESGDISANDIVRFLKPILGYTQDADRMDDEARDLRLNCTDECIELRRWAVTADLHRVREQRERARE